jgi:hypothetical protein
MREFNSLANAITSFDIIADEKTKNTLLAVQPFNLFPFPHFLTAPSIYLSFFFFVV